MQPFEILPPEIPNYSLPPGVRMPENIILTESEAADFLREPVSRLQKRRLAGTGPAFIRHEDEGWGARYFLWDVLRWACAQRRTEMPERPRRGSRKGAAQAAA